MLRLGVGVCVASVMALVSLGSSGSNQLVVGNMSLVELKSGEMQEALSQSNCPNGANAATNVDYCTGGTAPNGCITVQNGSCFNGCAPDNTGTGTLCTHISGVATVTRPGTSYFDNAPCGQSSTYRPCVSVWMYFTVWCGNDYDCTFGNATNTDCGNYEYRSGGC